MFFGAKLKAMPAKLVTDDGAHTVIRPLAYCAEKDIARYARAMEFPIIPCNLCGSQQNLQRQAIKSMLHDWEKHYPGRTEIIFQSLQNVTPSHLLDGELFDFKNLSQRLLATEGDIVFDDPIFAEQKPETETDDTVVELKQQKY
jgi:tRNA 2-thiocytidine biosynthesis protein TtcA